MTGWTTHTGRAAALPLANVDTDQLIPARFMSTPRSEGYGRFLLHDTDARIPEGTTILVAGPNFGSGSSREAAVYALVDFGIRAVIAPSFGDIFAANAANNGLLPACIPEAETLWPRLPAELTIDLAAGTVTGLGETLRFTLDETRRDKLIHGWDDIDLTARHAAAIAAFRGDHHNKHPWAVPARDNNGSGHPTGEEI
ncbi:3-isopropylmalate dehydratase small subunit [Jannaschia seohaensis]|uniref:3-isopropylmalate dehydratase n=1 Tax=Jannaschia seohaensis TaxID=475081 RepID=A0A2Y9AY97_9RHOB|nr:3-isopropylmalate dehydratase small subunit [Jannaschia seohaensis]PWJ16209.1 3-isopropylmalate/(R)-2-methylmalate dehydratase small subunit [Jannaschia seohaensis]SSA49240.1 3-isopropylmalate/(R)-2-methylmalate dehydratase small subunit [Jannaschia seohaensis]